VSPDCNRFSIFVSGLSNGWNVETTRGPAQDAEMISAARDRYFMDSASSASTARPSGSTAFQDETARRAPQRRPRRTRKAQGGGH